MSSHTMFDKDVKQVLAELKEAFKKVEASRLEFRKNRPRFWPIFFRVFLILLGSMLILFNFILPQGEDFMNTTGRIGAPIFIGVTGGLVIGFIIWVVKEGKEALDPYKKLYKEEIIGGMFRALEPNTEFDPDRGLEAEQFYKLGAIDPTDRAYSYGSEDLIKIKTTGLDLQMGEVRVTRTYSNRERNRTKRIFNGFFLISESGRTFSSTTMVLSKKDGILGEVFSGLSTFLPKALVGGPHAASISDPVDIGNPTFSKAFDVYSTGAGEAKTFINPTVMKLLLELKAIHRGQVLFTLKEGKIFFAVSWDTMGEDAYRDMFEPPELKKPAYQPEKIHEYYRDFKLMCDLALQFQA